MIVSRFDSSAKRGNGFNPDAPVALKLSRQYELKCIGPYYFLRGSDGKHFQFIIETFMGLVFKIWKMKHPFDSFRNT